MGMLDKDLLVRALRDRGHAVGEFISVPANAGEYEIYVDGNLLTLSEVRALLESEEPK
jgi:hypothetical protein